MKHAFVLGSVIWFALISAVPGAQTERPKSPAGSSATQIGGSVFDPSLGWVGGRWIEILYGRPITRGRDVFGPDDFAEALNDGAPVWRAGANVSTRLNTEVPLQVGGRRLAAGEYTVFIELGRRNWTFIVSAYRARTAASDPNDKEAIFGAFDYTPDKDLVRVRMTRETLPHSFDQLHWEFMDVTPKGGRLGMIWANQLAWIPFTVVQ
jgi:hypothetical protein